MLMLMIVTLTVWMAPSAAAQGVSQITMSCSSPPPESHTTNGCRSTELAPPPSGTPPITIGDKLLIVGGFWIWCQNPNGGTPYGPDCAGSVYVEEVNLVSGAGKYGATSITGSSSASGPTGLQVSFKSSDGDMACMLNVPANPTSGGSNTLSGFCDGVPISFSNVVVNVTK
jgi:hypothetical protein